MGKTDSGGECGVPAELRFHPWLWAKAGAPGAGPLPKTDAPWYSFDYGPVHVLFISTEPVKNERRCCLQNTIA